MDYFFDEPEFLDPASWNAASYTHHPVDDLEPIPDHSSSYRDAALECLRILASVDSFMSRARDPRLAWTAVSGVIGLTSTSKLTEAEIGRQLGVTELSVHRAMAKFVKLANLDPAGGLRALGQIRSNGGPRPQNLSH
jgi:hypothetical protein